MHQTIICHSPEDMEPAAKSLLQAFPAGRMFALYGRMGAGKTTFIKAICHQLGVTDIVNSPTFSIVNEYSTASGKNIFHFDLYRLKNTNELLDIGYEEYFYSGSYCLLEWPEKIEELLPEECVRVKIEEDDYDKSRIISF
ncbi:MAG: tRNA (adenosine(37)-N6)-threonylcarbamoyltransferase complex ATPase subunit type 1 TsaE [Bacteroidales bacterium]